MGRLNINMLTYSERYLLRTNVVEALILPAHISFIKVHNDKVLKQKSSFYSCL